MINQNTSIKEAKNNYTQETPKYVIIDDLFDQSFIKECQDEFLNIEESGFIRYSNPYFEFDKYTMNDTSKMPSKLESLFRYVHSEDFINIASEISGIDDLLVDEKRWGGGLHMTKKGGYLSVHKDFNVLPTSYSEDLQMLRCVNLIGYLNDNWKPGDGGELEFWDESGNNIVERIEPKFNRWVLFDTRNNYHGQPYPYKGDSPRISIASYYYIKTKVVEDECQSTVYLKLPWMEESDEYSRERINRANPKLRYTNLLKK